MWLVANHEHEPLTLTTGMGIFSKISSLFTGKRALDTVTAESLSDALIAADIAPDLAETLVSKLRARGTIDADTAKQILFEAMLPMVNKLIPLSTFHFPLSQSPKHPLIVLVIGVNGAGKTTTIGKLAKKWGDDGTRVVIGAADTFRAAATEQLTEWATRAGAMLMTADENSKNADPATVAYRAIDYGQKNDADIVILDTAGRLHNRADLMDELAKMTRVIKKLDEKAPHETWLVLDANTGQNGTAQVEHFAKTTPLSGLIVTKMDSTAKGGFLVTYAAREKSPLPIAAIGYGEKIADLKPFDAGEYLKKLLDM